MASKRDYEQIIQDVHDEPNHALQVNVVAGTISTTNPSVGVNGDPAPTSSNEIAGIDPSGNLTPVSVDATGKINVNLSTATIEIGEVDQGSPNTSANAWPVKPTDGTNSQVFTVSGEAKVIATGAATEVTLASFSAKSSGALVPVAYDEVALVYVASGNGTGQIQTATYKLASSTVKTLTLSYDSSNRLSGVVAS